MLLPVFFLCHFALPHELFNKSDRIHDQAKFILQSGSATQISFSLLFAFNLKAKAKAKAKANAKAKAKAKANANGARCSAVGLQI